MTGPLSAVGDGILGTHVLWSDVEFEIQKALGTSATFGDNKTVRNIGEGIGFFSRICLVDPDWQRSEQEPLKKLPTRFVVKIISQLAMLEAGGENAITDFLEKKSPQLLRAEINAYDLFNKYGDASFATGKMLGFRCLDETNQTKGFFIMEYIDKIESVGLYDNISIDNCREVLKVVAKWHAISLKHSSEFEKLYETHFLSNIYGLDVTHRTCTQTLDGLEDVDHPVLQSKMGKLREIIDELCTEENLLYFDELCEKMNMKRVFAHCDIWSPNILWDRKDNGELSLRAIVDYQLASLSNPMIDFVMFLVCNINADERRSHTKQLIQDFHNYLSAEMDNENPFTIEQLEDCYQRIFPIAVLLIYGMVGPTYLSTLQKKPEESQKTTEIFEKKILATLDEVIEIHELNKK